VEAGNYSTPLLASSWLGVDLSAIAGALLALLVASLVVVRWPVAGWRPRAALAATVSTFGRLFGDPHAAVAAALGLTMAASPLAWVHYYVLLLIPSLWLLGSGAVSPAVPVLAALGVVMSGGILGLALWGLGWPGAMPATIALSWLPLWAALLIDLRWSDGAAAVAGQAVPDARPRRPRRGPPR